MKKVIGVALFLILATSACGFGRQGNGRFQQFADSAGLSETATPAASDTPLPTDTPSPVPVPTLTGTPTPQAFPVVTFSQNANCRKGPGLRYYNVVAYTKGQTAQLAGRNEDASWFWVRMANERDYCWTSASTIVDFGDASVLSVIPYQTLPDDPASIAVTKKSCGGVNILRIEWSDVQAEQGYRLYLDGALLRTFPPGVTYVMDYPRNAKAYVYAVEAFNEYGVSRRTAITEPGC